MSRVLRFHYFNCTIKRNLFNKASLGLDRFEKQMENYSFDNAKFKAKLKLISEDTSLKILTHDMKHFLHLIDTEEDFKSFEPIIARYAETTFRNENTRFGTYRLGPVLMRLYHKMNKPHEALALLNHPDHASYLGNLSALIILQDLLYDNGMYKEVCDIFEMIKKKQFHGRVYHVSPYILYQAACYKMGTPESFNNAMEDYKKFIKFNKKPWWPVLMYTSILALEYNSLDIPIKHCNREDPTAINIELAAYIKLGDCSQALNIFNQMKHKSVIMKAVAEDLDRLTQNIEATENDPQLRENVKVFKSELGKSNLIDKTFDELSTDTISIFEYILPEYNFKEKNKIPLEIV